MKTKKIQIVFVGSSMAVTVRKGQIEAPAKSPAAAVPVTPKIRIDH